jgi:hypothetical protein
MPEARHHHVLDGALLAIRQFHLHLSLFPAHAGALAAFRAWPWRADTGSLAADKARLRLFALTRLASALRGCP